MRMLAKCLPMVAVVAAGLVHTQGLPPVGDAPYPGTITLQVDATDIDHKVFQVRESLPVRPGRLTLLFPRWMPGEHGPTNEIKRLAGLRIQAAGKPLAWTRDADEMHAFHVDVPVGVAQLDIAFQHLMPRAPQSGSAVLSRDTAFVPWGRVLLYPAGHAVDRITVQANLALPAGWQQASALRTVSAGVGPQWTYQAVSVEALVDSPVFAGRHMKRYDLDPGGRSEVALSVFAAEPKHLEASDEQLAAHRNLVAQADRLFGARHFRHYDFMLMLGDAVDYLGLEHHESSENGFKPRYFSEWAKASVGRDLLPHEFTHSWNGKFRRPRELWAPDFNAPTRNTQLWVYEGLTQYWGGVLAARSGIISTADTLADMAYTVAWAQNGPGRQWRALQDTVGDEIMSGRLMRQDWPSWQRFEDYYDEGALIWLDADTKIRELSGGKRSLDDFARAFFGVEDGRVAPLLYDFDDVVAALNRVQPLDWAGFMRERLDRVGAPAPLDGLARAGWRLAYSDKQSDYAKSVDAEFERADFRYSLGFSVGKEGKLAQVRWDSLAFKAGLAAGPTLLAVNLRAYSADVLKDAISAARSGTQPIELLLKEDDQYRIVKLDYHGGLRYPVLERIPGSDDRLSAILAPR